MEKKIRIGIIGFGRFGALAASVLKKHALVKVYHYRNNQEDIKKAKIIGVELVSLEKALEVDVVILAVPISQTEKIIRQIAGLVKPGTLVVDTCSVKMLPCQWLKKNIPAGIEIMGTHPMFGPVTTQFSLEKQSWQLKGKQIVLCPLRIQKARLRKIEKFLQKLGLEVIITLPENHDEQNAKTLGLVHYIGRALTGAHVGPQQIYTPGYSDLLKIIPHTNSDDWQLFYDMHNYNPFAEKVRNNFIDVCQKLDEKIEKSVATDEFEFSRRMIDLVDQQILELLEQRFGYVARIGKIKKQKGLKIIDRKREKAIIESKKKMTTLGGKFIEKLYGVIFKESYLRQK